MYTAQWWIKLCPLPRAINLLGKFLDGQWYNVVALGASAHC